MLTKFRNQLQKLFFLIFSLLLNCSATHNKKNNSKIEETPTVNEDYQFQFEQQQVNSFLEENEEYNSEITMFIDLGRASNKRRFFVYNNFMQRTTLAALVTHGSCDGSTANLGEKYSNTANSYCSSLGKYKIGKSYFGKFGLAYKLHGLENSNNNAYNRAIVLHSHDCVPNRESSLPICTSQGCPTVSPDFLDRIAPIIDGSEKPIVLWVFDSRLQSIS